MKLDYRYSALQLQTGKILATGNKLADVMGKANTVIVDYKKKCYSLQGIYPTRNNWQYDFENIGNIIRKYSSVKYV